MPKRAQHYIGIIIAAGALALAASLITGLHIGNGLQFAIYLALALGASMLKMHLPGMEGTYSLNTLFILFGLFYLSPGETMIAGCGAVAVQSFWRAKKKPTTVQLVFNLANVALSIAAGFAVSRIGFLGGVEAHRTALMIATAFVQFAVNTLVVSGILSLLQGEPVARVWEQWYEWSLPYYLVASALVGLLPVRGAIAQPEAWLILLPLLYLVHFFYGLSIAPSCANTAESSEPRRLPAGARFYVAGIVGAGVLLLARAVLGFDPADLGRFAGCLAVGLLVSTWKVKLPGMLATVSVGFVMTLFAIAQLPFSQALVISAALCAVQVFWKPRVRPPAIQAAFSIASLVIGTAAAFWLARIGLPPMLAASLPATLMIATGLLFLLNSLMVATAVCLAASQPLGRIWQNCYFWSLPYYLVGACLAGVMVMTSRTAGWGPSLLELPIMGMVYVSYRRHVRTAVARGVSVGNRAAAAAA